MATDYKHTMATVIYSNLSKKGKISDQFTDAHNLLASTTDGYKFLQLMMQQKYLLLVVKNIAKVDIPKYSIYKSIYRYSREIKQYLSKNGKKCSFSDKKTSHILSAPLR